MLLRKDYMLNSWKKYKPRFWQLKCSISTSSFLGIRQHVNPLSNQFYEPMELPDWKKVYSNPEFPLHLDIGSARGRYLIELAQNYKASEKKVNLLGIEIRQQLVVKANKDKEMKQLNNIHFSFGNMNLQLDRLMSSLPSEIRSISIFHPDPWFKKSHRKRRLINKEFITGLTNHISCGTPIFVQTDVKDLYIDICEVFSNFDCFQHEHLNFNPLHTETDREKSVIEMGGCIYRSKFVYSKPKQIMDY